METKTINVQTGPSEGLSDVQYDSSDQGQLTGLKNWKTLTYFIISKALKLQLICNLN